MQSSISRHPGRSGLLAAVLTLLASQGAARNGSDSPSDLVLHPIGAQQVAPGHANLVPVFRQSVDFAVSDKSFQIGYRENSSQQDGYWNIEALINDESDFALDARLMRVGQLVGTPLRLGVGIGAYAVFFDDSGQDLYALALVGSAQYDLPTSPPTTANLELAVAPDISTFRDGEDLLDLSLRIELQVSENALAFAGYRVLDANTLDDSEFTSELQVGVRLSL